MSADSQPTPRVVELRIHGVSGTPAKAVLGLPDTRVHAERVHGDRGAGFYRSSKAKETDDCLVEAYSWGGLTSGTPWRALWLLLLPFALLNAASWMEPGDPAAHRGTRRLAEGALRLLAFALTCALVTAAVVIAVDLITWQCAGSSACAAQNPVPRAVARLSTPGQQVAVASLVPAALIAVLWFLGRWTWVRYETKRPSTVQPPTTADPETETAESLGDHRFWCGDAPVQRLRCAHISGAWALLAVLVAWPLTGGSLVAESGPWLPRAFVIAGAVVLVTCLVVVCLPSIADRQASSPDPSSAVAGRPLRWVLALPWFAGALAAATLFWVLSARAQGVAGFVGFGDSPMPGVAGALEIQLWLQFVTLVVLCAAVARLHRRNVHEPGGTGAATTAHHDFALPALAAAALLTANGLSAAFAVEVAWRLTSPDEVRPPATYQFGSIAAVVVGLAVLAAGVTAFRQVRRRAALEGDPVGELYGSGARPAPGTYMKRIARARARAALTDSLPRYLFWVVVAALVAAVGLAVAYGSTTAEDRDDRLWGVERNTVAAVSEVLMIVTALGFLVLALAVLVSPRVRRMVGVVWDLVSFWPRAAHPLAPPCYAEKAVPDLVDRLHHLVESRRVVISAHSQGSVLAIATLYQLPEADCGKICLLTYGSPLTRLYGAFFPAYYSRDAFGDVMRRLGVPDPAPPPWINLYRLTDPIGGWVLREGLPLEQAAVDVLVADPALRAENEAAWPRTKGHSGYYPGPEYDAAVDEVLVRRA